MAPDRRPRAPEANCRKQRNRTALSQHDLRWIFALLASRHAAIAPTFAGICRKITAGFDILEEKTESLKWNMKAGSGSRVRWPQLSYFGLSVICSKSGLGHLSRDSTLLCHITGLDRSTTGDHSRQQRASSYAWRRWLSRPARVDAVYSASARERAVRSSNDTADALRHRGSDSTMSSKMSFYFFHGWVFIVTPDPRTEHLAQGGTGHLIIHEMWRTVLEIRGIRDLGEPDGGKGGNSNARDLEGVSAVYSGSAC